MKKFDGIIPMGRLMIDGLIKSSNQSGRQFVNRGQSKVSVSFHLKSADWLPIETRNKLGEIHETRISPDGIFRIRSDKTKSQTLNIADCIDRLRCYISEAEQPPSEELLAHETIELRRQRLERAAIERLTKIHKK